jgi:protein-disulfide isomerase
MNRLAAAALSLLIASPSLAAISREDLQKALEKNPDLVLAALKKADKTAFFKYVMEANQEFQAKKQAEEEAKEKAALEEAYKHPLKPAIDDKTRVRGDKKAPISIVEYSDFQCPYCGRGFQVVEEVRAKYGDKVRFIFKNLPLVAIHPNALPAAKWFEAISLQSQEKAWQFHDIMFKNQGSLSEDFYKKTAKDLGVDVEKAAKDAQSQAVSDKIDADSKEGKEFGFSGTPGFLINGIPLRGAYPAEDFDKIIKRLGV